MTKTENSTRHHDRDPVVGELTHERDVRLPERGWGLPAVDRLIEQPPGYRDRVRTLWVHCDVDAPAESIWALLTDLDRWPAWGPAVRGAELDSSSFEAGATGVVTTVLGVRLPFEITSYEDGARWAWKVAGMPATDHTVQALGPERCRVGFGVPWPATPYLAVCRMALRRIESIATQDQIPS